jgi:DNA-binding PadR family transcriptional regulator
MIAKKPRHGLAPAIATTAAIVQALARRGALYGLEIAAHVTEATGGAIVIQNGSLYPGLAALERKGLVVRTERSRGWGGRPCHYYELTDQGVDLAERDRKVAASLFSLRNAARQQDQNRLSCPSCHPAKDKSP